MFISIKTEDGILKGKISFYCKSLGVNVPSERTVYRVMEKISISHRPTRKPNGITKADKEARKSDDLIQRNFKSDKPLEKCVTDMTEVKCLNGKLYVSAVFDCFDSVVLGLAISKYGIIQSMNSAGGRCHDNARCESMWARLKEELLYNRYDASKMKVETVRTLIWRYFISYWNNRRICSTNGGLLPIVKRQQYYRSLEDAA